MHLQHLWINDFRSFSNAELALPAGLLAVVGDNGTGKTNLLEAVGYLATQESLRGASSDALVRAGCSSAVVRGQGRRRERELLIEAEVVPGGRSRLWVNRQPTRRLADLEDGLRVSMFTPDDLALVKAGPSGRRRYLDDVIAMLHPRHTATRRDYERVLRQRNALLAQIASRRGHLDESAAATLDVWDSRLVQTGQALGSARAALVDDLEPAVAKAYAQLAPATAGTGESRLSMAYRARWREQGLAAALEEVRAAERRRGVTLVGPHRDDLDLAIDDLPARTHASQGEQRCVALALRLGAHSLAADVVGESPLLLLDDVFSELDPRRTDALLAHLPPGQAVLTTAGALPTRVTPDHVVLLAGGKIQG